MNKIQTRSVTRINVDIDLFCVCLCLDLMTAACKFLFAMMTIGLIVGGQLFGIGFGYICHCHDTPLVTFVGHCHDDAEHGHHEELPLDHHDESGVPMGNQHEPNRSDLEVSPLSKVPTAPAPAFAILDPEHYLLVPPIRETLVSSRTKPHEEPLHLRSPVLLITRCTVILV